MASREVRMLDRFVFALALIPTLFASLPALAGERDLAKPPAAGYSESLCIAGVAADDSRRVRDVAGELRACNERVKAMKVLNRVSFSIQLCENSFREKPLQLKACYLQTMALNAPSESMANIGMECVQHKNDATYSACVRQSLVSLDQLLRAGNSSVTQRNQRPQMKSASIVDQD